MTYRQLPLKSCLAASIIALGLGSSALAEEVIKLHHDQTTDSAQHDGTELFRDLVEERTNGRYTVEIYPNNALRDDVEVAQQMQFGAVHAAPIPTAKLTGFARDLGIIDLPFLFPSREVAYEFMDSDTGMGIMDGLRDSGFEPAMFWESGFKQFTCNHAVNGPEDFANRNVRVMESPLLIAQFQALDARPVPISFSETYTALQQGVVECQENPLVSIANMKFNEVQDYLMISNHGYLGTAFIFSKVWFEGIPAEDQAILKQAVLDAGTFQREQSVAREQSYLDTIVAEGSTEVIEISDAEMANFRSAMDPVYEDFGASLDDGVLAEVLTSVDRLSQ